MTKRTSIKRFLKDDCDCVDKFIASTKKYMIDGEQRYHIEHYPGEIQCANAECGARGQPADFPRGVCPNCGYDRQKPVTEVKQ